MLPLRHLRPGGEASLRTPEQLGQFPLLALHTVKPNFSVYFLGQIEGALGHWHAEVALPILFEIDFL